MKVTNMVSSKGNKVPNQFIIESANAREFQSYKTTVIRQDLNTGATFVDAGYPFSKTTSKYASLFLDETSKDIKRKIKSGEYITADLNK